MSKYKELNDVFDVIVTSEDVKNCKPAPDALLACLKKLGLLSDKAVYIGDAKDDMDAAYAANITFVYCDRYGNKQCEINGISDFNI